MWPAYGQVGLLNVDGYYDPLLTLFDKGVEEGFIKLGARHIVLSAPTSQELLTIMEVIYIILILRAIRDLSSLSPYDSVLYYNVIRFLIRCFH